MARKSTSSSGGGGTIYAGGVKVNISADTSPYMKAINDISRSTSHLVAQGGVLARAKSAFMGVGAAMVVFSTLGAITDVFSRIARAGPQMNVVLEEAGIQFTHLTGSAKEAKDLVAELFRFAATTPFETEPVLRAGRLLLNMGIAAQDVTYYLRMVGDAAAVSGVEIDRMAFYFGRVWASIRAGLPLSDELRRMFEVGALPAEVAIKLRELSARGLIRPEHMDLFLSGFQKAKGATQDLADSWIGLKTTIADTFGLLMGTAIKPWFEDIKDIMKEWRDTLLSPEFEAKFLAHMGALRESFDKLGEAIPDFREGKFWTLLDWFRRFNQLAAASIKTLSYVSRAYERWQPVKELEAAIPKGSLFAFGKGVSFGAWRGPLTKEQEQAKRETLDKIAKLRETITSEEVRLLEEIETLVNLAGTSFVGLEFEGLGEAQKQIDKLKKGLTGTGPAAKSAGGGMKEAAEGADALALKAMKAAKQTEEMNAAIKELFDTLDQQILIADMGKNIDKWTASIEKLVEEQKTLQDIFQEQLAARNKPPTIFSIAGISPEFELGQVGLTEEQKNKIRDDMEEMGEMGRAIESVFEEVGDAISDTLLSVIQGTRDTKEAFRDMAESILAKLLDLAIQTQIIDPLGTWAKGVAKGTGFWGSLFSSVGGFFGVGKKVAGAQEGGIFTRPSITSIAEREPELALPLSKLPRFTETLTGREGGRPIELTVINALNAEDLTAIGISRRPGVVLNVIGADYQRRGPTRRMMQPS